LFLKLTLLAAPIVLAWPNACAAPYMVARQRADVAATESDVAGSAAPRSMTWLGQINIASEPAPLPARPPPAASALQPPAASASPLRSARGRPGCARPLLPRPASPAAPRTPARQGRPLLRYLPLDFMLF